jgi:DNA-binding phage protein
MAKISKKSNLKPEATKYDKMLRVIREEFVSQWIHTNLKVTAIAVETGLAYKTVKNFLDYKTRRPATTTLLAIGDAIGLEITVQKIETKAKGEIIHFNKYRQTKTKIKKRA